MRNPRSQLALAAVAFILGVLVIVQLRAQSGGSGLENASAQDLTVLVANLNARNDQLRTEIATLDRELTALVTGQASGDTALRALRSDLERVRAWAGLMPVTGPGISVTISGPIDGAGVEHLLNELRNAGAEAMAVEDVRVVGGTVVAGPPGGLVVEATALGTTFEVSALGSDQALTGSLTRAGGIVAQLRATFPDVSITVTPSARIVVPATGRDLVPRQGRPRL